ncbi:MAG: tetratricopeptide repeat protein, partial [Candidatus Sumerlaeota bacterium]|nr:tetratricopeptide repeat protein [Candidatus Sumerlaeota bacterium]
NPLEEGSRAFLTNGPASLALLLAAALAVLLLSRKIPAVGLGAVWFLAALLPNLPFWPTFLVLTESKLLLPTLGLSLAIAGVVFAVANERQPLLEGARNTTVAVVAALAWTSMAALAYSRGLDWKSGPDLWRAERALHPNDETALLSTAFYQRQSGHLDEAEKTLHLALDNYTSRPAVYYELAYTYLAQGKKAEALDILNRAMQLAPAPRGDFYVKVGLLYEQLDDTEKSTAAFERGIEGDPENWSLHFLLGNTLLTRRDLAQAISQYSSALAEAPPQYAGAILLNRAMARRQSGDLDGALADAEKGVQLDPFEPRLRIELSDAWLAKGADSQVAGLDDAARSKLRTEVAEKALNVLHDGVTQISPPDRDIYLSYADLLRQVGMVDEAARWATRARELFPADPKTRLYEATLLLALDRYNEAGRLFASMMDDPKLRNHPTAIAGLGFCLFQRGANDQAARERDETALRLDRTNPLGLLLYRLLVEKGVAMDPDLVRGLPPTVIMPRGPVQPKYEQPQGPVELPVRPPTP